MDVGARYCSRRDGQSLVWCVLVPVPGAGQGSGREVRSGRTHGTCFLERNMLAALLELENGTGGHMAVNASCVSQTCESITVGMAVML